MEERLDNLGFTADSFAPDVSDHKSDCDGNLQLADRRGGNPSIYCGTWAKYNDGNLQLTDRMGGNLTGLWIDLTTFDDFEDFINFCKGFHADEVIDEVAWLCQEHPELDAQDWENLPSGLDGDDLFIEEKWNILKEYLDLCDRFDADAVDAYCNIFGIEYLSNFEERYQGEYKTMEDFAEYIVSELYDLDRIMGHMSCYFDYEKYGRDLVIVLWTLCSAKNATTRSKTATFSEPAANPALPLSAGPLARAALAVFMILALKI